MDDNIAEHSKPHWPRKSLGKIKQIIQEFDPLTCDPNLVAKLTKELENQLKAERERLEKTIAKAKAEYERLVRVENPTPEMREQRIQAGLVGAAAVQQLQIINQAIGWLQQWIARKNAAILAWLLGIFAVGQTRGGGRGDEDERDKKEEKPDEDIPAEFPRAKVIGIPESSDVVTIWKAPGKSNTVAAGEVKNGFDPANYPGDGPYMATDVAIAEDFLRSYDNGLQEFNIPRRKFDELVYRGVIKPDGYYESGRSWHVPADKLPEFNEAIKQGPANQYHP